MRMIARTIALTVVLGMLPHAASAGQRAARLGDGTAHGGTITTGLPTVLINGTPAARVGDLSVDPLVIGLVPCTGGPIITGSSTVLIGGSPAARVGDQMARACGLLDTVSQGSPNVLIGP